MKYKVYMHTSPSGKKYIGLTSRNIEARWRNGEGYQTQNYFYRAINKYGWENIEHKIMATNLSKEQAINLEIELIAKYDTTNPDKGYNMTIGGELTTYSDEARKNMSEAQRLRNIENPINTIKLNYKIADEIREVYLTSKYSRLEISNIYKVSYTTILQIIDNSIWKNEDYEYIDLNLLRARKIRKDYATGNYLQKELAEKYMTNTANISLIVNNKIWVE